MLSVEARRDIEDALLKHLPVSRIAKHADFNAALSYAVFPGGKRIRPILALLGAQIVGGAYQTVLPAAAAIEYIHIASLILDDLPCMDNASTRRERPALHIRYGEDQALLVAVALMNVSYQLVLNCCPSTPERAIRAHNELTTCIGADGMIGGQTIDLALKRQQYAIGISEKICNVKTSALIQCAVRLGAMLCGADERQLQALAYFAELLGNALQKSDDLEDIREDMSLAAGVPIIEPQAVETAKKSVAALVSEAKNVISVEFGVNRPTQILCEIADFYAVTAESMAKIQLQQCSARPEVVSPRCRADSRSNPP